MYRLARKLLNKVLSPFWRLREKRRISRFDVAPFQSAQEEMFNRLGFDYQAAQLLTRSILESKFNSEISQHYVVAAALISQKGVRSILEIGTQSGNFAAFLAKLDPEVRVVTVDLPSSDTRYDNATNYWQQEKTRAGAAEALVAERTRNLSRCSNVTFRELNSIELTTMQDAFDLIFVDGDHTFPMVVVDAMNAIRMVGASGWILFDDLRPKDGAVSEFGGSETTLLVDLMEQNGILEVFRFHKRLSARRLVDPIHRKQIALAKPSFTFRNLKSRDVDEGGR